MQQLTDAFNASQSKVHVNLVAQTSYADTWQKYQAGLSNGQLPNVVQLQDSDTQGAIDTGSMLPVQSCMKGFNASPGDLLPRALSYWKVQGTQWAMPFAVSGPVLYYNKLAFQKAGLDPSAAPKTLTELVTDAKILKAAGQGGFGLKVDSWYVESELGLANQLFVNHENGRSGLATASTVGGSAALATFTAFNQMVAAGTAGTNSVGGTDVYDNLLGIASGKYAMSIDTSASLGTIVSLISQYPNLQLGVAPLPSVQNTPTGGVEPAGSALWISKKSSPAEQAAAWEYISFMDSATSQATWSVSTGYVPLRTAAAQSATVQNAWAKEPGFKVAYTQLTSGAVSPASAGGLVGPYDSVRTAIQDAENSMFVHNVSPSTALAAAQVAATKVISDYNQRFGKG